MSNTNMLITNKSENIGLDKRIENAKIDEMETLLKEISIEESESRKNIYIVKLAKVLGINKTSIEKDVKKNEEKYKPELKAVFTELIDLALTDKGEVSYIVKSKNDVFETDKWTTKDGTVYLPPSKKHLNFSLVKYEKFLEGLQVSEREIYFELLNYLKRFSYVEEEVWPILVLDIFLSYLQDHPCVRYIPVIYFYAVAERGKSRTAKSMLSVAYRGVHLTDLMPANIFRYSENLKATLFLDCTDLWKSAEKSGCTDILLNRFEKGGTVSRVLNPDRGAFEDQKHYEIYGSTIVATNEPASPIFESRCLTITMPNRPGEYEDPTPDKGLELKAKLTAWRAKMMGKELPHVERPSGISGRLWDISKPIFQLCELIYPEARGTMENVLREMAGQKVEDKKQTLEGRIVFAISKLANFDCMFENVIPSGEILKIVNYGTDTRYHVKSQTLGKRLQSLSLKTNKVNGYSHLKINKNELALLMEQYGILVESESVVDSEDQLSTMQVAEIVEERRVVESGRELQGTLPHSHGNQPVSASSDMDNTQQATIAPLTKGPIANSKIVRWSTRK